MILYVLIPMHREWDFDLKHARTASTSMATLGKDFPYSTFGFSINWKPSHSGKLISSLLVVFYTEDLGKLALLCMQ